MKQIIIMNPKHLVFGNGSLAQFETDFITLGFKKLFILSISVMKSNLDPVINTFKNSGIEVEMDCSIIGEPTFKDFEKVLQKAKDFNADSVIGVGGGSVLDTAKLIAAQLKNKQSLEQVKGIGNLKERKTYVACIPTTSGTGSEVSPNAIFVDELGAKVGIISPYLVADAAYIDPELTISLPKSITASTGIDALTHCLEAYTNKFSHPIVDIFALEGVKIIGQFIERACLDGKDLEARTQVALGSLYGGMCLGPVNTTAVHALSYPLGVKYHIPHGLSNALLLPYVMEYNIQTAPEKFEHIALVLGAQKKTNPKETAMDGVRLIKKLISDCGIPTNLKEAGINSDDIPDLAKDAIEVQRLLRNNIREVKITDAENIYKSAFG